DRDVVGVPAPLELDALDTGETDGAAGTGERRLHHGAVGIDFVAIDAEGLAGCFADEVERVEPVAAVDRGIAVARIPDERVVAVAEERSVVAFIADNDVFAVAAKEGVGGVGAVEGVLAVAGV